MGHAGIETTMRYLRHVRREEDACLVAEVFALESAPEMEGRLRTSLDV